MKKTFLVLAGLFFVVGCTGSFVGVPNAVDKAELADDPIYQLKPIFRIQNTTSNGLTSFQYINDCPAPCQQGQGLHTCTIPNVFTCQSFDVFQLLTDQDLNLIKNINEQLKGTVAACPSDVVIPSLNILPGLTRYYFLKLGQTSATGVLMDGASAVCKMSFTRRDLDASVTPKTERLTPESTYDQTYTFDIEEVIGAPLTPQTPQTFKKIN